MKSLYKAEAQYSRILMQADRLCRRDGVAWWDFSAKIPARLSNRVAKARAAVDKIALANGFLRKNGVLTKGA